MIYTLTLNPSIDYIVRADNVTLGSLNRATATAFYPGGKGINVSRVLHNLGVNSTALGYLGGFTGVYIKEQLSSAEIACDFVQLDEPTRINIKLKTDQETEVNGNSPYVSQVKQTELLDKISKLTAEDFLVMAGSLPQSVAADFYEIVAERCIEKNIPFIIDTSGNAFERILDYKPFLIKPNQHELEDLLDVKIHSVEDAIQYGSELLQKGPSHIIVSLGGDGAVFISEGLKAVAHAPTGVVKNTVGAGDSTVAGFLSSYVQHNDLLKAFQFGVAAGSATAFSEDLCTKSEVEKLLPQVKVEKL
ncbi:1-phosphofructokinase [Bacillus sp. Marseille-P3661]|uniref:1-phosphofructokinase n=1 Tax=Bacillus sp. Marseille-P3661 TaxID=1936234 RepID=UPI000C81ABF7|nr:1-phosphofructokinase [Bacillus sp. Marseille-P3661]